MEILFYSRDSAAVIGAFYSMKTGRHYTQIADLSPTTPKVVILTMVSSTMEKSGTHK